jgi:hypothetical protein
MRVTATVSDADHATPVFRERKYAAAPPFLTAPEEKVYRFPTFSVGSPP